MTVKEIKHDELLPVRMSVLRPGRPIEEGYFEGDSAEDTFHLGVYDNGNLSCVASFYREGYDGESGTGYRLRSMATIPDARGKGLGRQIMNTAFDLLKERDVNYLWCNARTSAIGFYEKLGMKVISEEFEIPVIGPHKVMIKKF